METLGLQKYRELVNKKKSFYIHFYKNENETPGRVGNFWMMRKLERYEKQYFAGLGNYSDVSREEQAKIPQDHKNKNQKRYPQKKRYQRGYPQVYKVNYYSSDGAVLFGLFNIEFCGIAGVIVKNKKQGMSPVIS